MKIFLYFSISALLALVTVRGSLFGSRSGSKIGKLKKDSQEGTIEQVQQDLASFLHRNGRRSDVIGKYEVDEVSRAISSLMNVQKAVKTMDGATHQLRNTFKESSSLRMRYEKFVRKKSKNKKEAAKLLEYIYIVERGLQACEIIQAVAEKDPAKRFRYLEETGLQEVGKVDIEEGRLRITLTLLTTPPGPSEATANSTTPSSNTRSGELFLVVTGGARSATTEVMQLLHLLHKERKAQLLQGLAPMPVPIAVHPPLFRLAWKSLDALHPLLSPYLSLAATNSSAAAAPARLWVLGHGVAGGVAGLLSLFLHGTLPTANLTLSTASSSWAAPELSQGNSTSLGGRWRGRVRCISLGAPPCMSRGLVPAYLTSIVCGDDVMCRAEGGGLDRLRDRVGAALRAGAGKAGLGGLLAGGSLLKDVSSVTSDAVKRYRGKKKRKGAAGDGDRLAPMGRVFFIKNRELKQGATLQRVFRGNWQEDVLWGLEDIVLSHKMLAHHMLDSYIQTLNRC
eukprot:gene36021-43686_t